MIRIAATTLEAYRRLLTNEYASEAELANAIAGQPFEPSWQMQAGTAWQLVLSTGCADWTGGNFVPTGGFSFGPMKAINEAYHHIGEGLSEVKSTKAFKVGGIAVTLVAQVDHVRGLFLQENKAKFSGASARDYEKSLQWRMYLLCHDAACCRYNLFSFADPKGGYCELKAIDSFRFWTYPALEADVLGWVRKFLDWTDSRGLTHYLDREGSTLTVEAA